MSLIGNAYLSMGKFVEADASFEEALKLKTDFPDALIGKAKLAAAAKDIDNMNKFADLAVSKNPSYAPAWFFKADLARIQGKLDDALKSYGETIKLQPENVSALLVRANLQIGMKKYAEAKQDIDAAKNSLVEMPSSTTRKPFLILAKVKIKNR